MTKKIIIKQKMSGTGNIYSLASDCFDREVTFRLGCSIAVMFPAYFNGHQVKLFKSETQAAKYARKNKDFCPVIFDYNGTIYDIQDGTLYTNGYSLEFDGTGVEYIEN